MGNLIITALGFVPGASRLPFWQGVILILILVLVLVWARILASDLDFRFGFGFGSFLGGKRLVDW